MGLAVLDDLDTQYDSSRHLPTALSALISQASIPGVLSPPPLTPAPSLDISYSSQRNDGILVGDVIPSIPGHVRSEPLMSPVPDDIIASDMNLVVGGALAPIQTAPQRPPAPSKAGPGLRLPSFERLGIAAPHPDRVRGAGKDGIPPSPTAYGVYQPAQVASDASHLSPVTKSVDTRSSIPDDIFNPEIERGAGRSIHSCIHYYVNTITPPSESSAPDWQQPATVQIAGMHSPPTDPENVVSGTEETEAPASPHPSAAVPVDEVDEADEVMHDGNELSWIDGAVDMLLENIRTASRPTASLKILSHALPSTSPSGHIFGKVISAVHVSTPVSPLTPLTWINVFHAIPGRFNLADVPTSPPNTPGPPIGGEDYFTQKIFDSAVSILDYQDDLTSLPRSPRPVVPPSSIDVSIVERYIPPSTSHEFAQMFDPNGSSILVDRLVELSPENGSLLFIYPTRNGAQTFMREYLGPILDPILRTMVVVHGLSTDLCISLGNMTTVHQLLDFSSLEQRIVTLCASLTQQDTAAQRFHGRRPVFSLSYSAKQDVKVPRGVWAREWWTKQEKTRLKQTIDSRYQESQPRRGSINEYGPQSASPTVLLQQLLDGVAGNPKQNLQEPEEAIEVGVFVITRSE